MINFFTAILFTVMNAANAFAQGAPAQAQPSTWEMLVMPAGFLAIMYFFMIRPQQKRAKDHKAFLNALKPGDEVVTTGGIIGRIKTVQDTFVSVEVAANTIIKVVKSEVSGLTQKAQQGITEKA
jgi:preprotein translocase subunit YajC